MSISEKVGLCSILFIWHENNCWCTDANFDQQFPWPFLHLLPPDLCQDEAVSENGTICHPITRAKAIGRRNFAILCDGVEKVQSQRVIERVSQCFSVCGWMGHRISSTTIQMWPFDPRQCWGAPSLSLDKTSSPLLHASCLPAGSLYLVRTGSSRKLIR